MTYTPYYNRGGITIYLGDAREISVDPCDLLVTDPPYGVSFKSNRRTATESFTELVGDDDNGWVRPALDVIVKRSLRRQRHAYVFGPSTSLPDRLAAKCEIVWDKCVLGSGDLTLPWSSNHEPINFAVHVASQANRAGGFGKLAARMRQGSVISVQRPHARGVSRHPTEKPVELLRQLIESSSCIGETVLDPFMGSGSTLIAAIAEGRNAVGIEIDEQWVDAASKRCDAALDAVAEWGKL